MPRVRISTTVDQDLLERARALGATNDSSLMELALAALVDRHRQTEHDAAYAGYDQVPPDAPDEWGDLASWRDAAAAT